MFFLSPVAANFIYDNFIVQGIPAANAYDMPIRLAQMYPLEILIFLVAGLLFLVLQTWAVFALGKMLKEKSAKIGTAISFAFSKLGKCIELAFFILVILFLYFAALWLFLALSVFSEMLAIALMLVWFLLGIYIAIKLAFFQAAFATETEKVKDAIIKSWTFSDKKFFGTLIFLIIVLGIAGIIEGLAYEIGFALPSDELASVLIAIMMIFISTYTNVAVIKFYHASK